MRPPELIALLFSPLLGCSLVPDLFGTQVDVSLCHRDQDCAQGQVCYIDGCGDPGQNLAVEVVPNDGYGGAQDFLVPPGDLRPSQILDLFPPAKVDGTALRGSAPYSGRLTLSAAGESLVIPGVHRRYGPATTTASGDFSIPVGSGRYTLSAVPADLTLPGYFAQGVDVAPGQTVHHDVLLPGPEELISFTGRIVRTSALDPVQTRLEVQLQDIETQRPLSQRLPVALTGDFIIWGTRPNGTATSVLLQVSPADATAMVPRKAFTLPLSGSALATPLELGDYGSAVAVQGRILDAVGAPVEAATVYLDGRVAGGGSFKTAAATTNASGQFTLQALAGDPAVPMTLYAIPDAHSRAGIGVTEARVPFTGGALGDFHCPLRIRVTGQVLTPNGTPASGVEVTAEAAEAVDGHLLPSDSFAGRTGQDGTYELWADPALYRLVFDPGELLPKVSRYLAVRAELDDAGAALPLAVPAFALSAGRTMTGVVTMRAASVSDTPAPAPNATIRIFRLVTVEGTPASLLLAQSVSDASGNFEVMLPTRPPLAP